MINDLHVLTFIYLYSLDLLLNLIQSVLPASSLTVICDLLFEIDFDPLNRKISLLQIF